MAGRQTVINALTFLVLTMVFLNFYTFILILKREGDKAIERRLSDDEDRRQRFLNNTMEREENADGHHRTGTSSAPNVTSIRFIRYKDSRVELHTARNLNQAQVEYVTRQINDHVQQRNLGDTGTIQGYIRLIGRLRRALGSSSSSSNLIDLEVSDTKGFIPSMIWNIIKDWPQSSPALIRNGSLGQVLRSVSGSKILQAKTSRRGTQLKMEFLLDGGQISIFKPEWYPRDIRITGDVYGGKDRHFGEISAFYLSLVLGFNAPLTVGRKLNLVRDILPISSKQLKSTFYRDEGILAIKNAQNCDARSLAYEKERMLLVMDFDLTFLLSAENVCFYGVCYYCKKESPVCAKGQVMEGAMILLMNQRLMTIPSPWRRTYLKDKYAEWETNMSYCQNLQLNRGSLLEPADEGFILDMVATSIFDFLIGNGDRHHLNLFSDQQNKTHNVTGRGYGHSRTIVLIDNGKSFGNAFEDYIDILAPLYQCCKIRQSLLETLKSFTGSLGKALDAVTTFDPLYPLLTHEHLSALNRRLIYVLATVQVCQDNHPTLSVVIED